MLGTLRKIGLDRRLGPEGLRCRDLALALIVSRLVAPTAKRATAKALDPATAASSLGAVLGLGPVDEEELDTALDWLLARQPAIETALARRHLRGGTLVLYDGSSSSVAGRGGALARLGYNRDGKKGKLQIVYGLLCAADGCPVAIEVFAGDVADPATLAGRITGLKRRFGLSHVVLVGDRGLITQARIDDDLKPAGLDWITASRAPTLKALVDGGALQLSLFDERDRAAITAPAFPGERLIGCRNPDLARERRRKREALLAATERDLAAIAAAVARQRRPLKGAAAIGLKVGVGLDRPKMAKHFELTLADARFRFARKTRAIAAEAALDGLYVVRTRLPPETLDDTATGRAYQSLAWVERAFRCRKTVDLQIRPIYHGLADRVRAHGFLGRLACQVEWPLRARLAPMLYDDADPEAAAAARASIVAKSERSSAAPAKQTPLRAPGRPPEGAPGSQRSTADGLPVPSCQSLLADLATLTRNTLLSALAPEPPFHLIARPTPIQKKAFDLLGLALRPYPVAAPAFEVLPRQLKGSRPIPEGSSG